MDINAAFPSEGRGRLIYTMSGKEMDGDLICWTASFLSDPMVNMVTEGNVMERHPLEAGIPQVSPVFPIVFAIYTSQLIKMVEERVAGIESLPIVGDI
jgi:hypothetical protein